MSVSRDYNITCMENVTRACARGKAIGKCYQTIGNGESYRLSASKRLIRAMNATNRAYLSATSIK